MTNDEIVLVEKLMVKSISEEEFRNKFPIDIMKNPNYVKQLLEAAYQQKARDNVEYSLLIGFIFDVFTKDFVEILCKLLEASWHVEHENIASILQDIKSPESVDSLFKTIFAHFDYLDFDESYALAVKCIWALGDINTDESRHKLNILVDSENEIVKENAIHQLSRRFK